MIHIDDRMEIGSAISELRQLQHLLPPIKLVNFDTTSLVLVLGSRLTTRKCLDSRSVTFLFPFNSLSRPRLKKD